METSHRGQVNADSPSSNRGAIAYAPVQDDTPVQSDQKILPKDSPVEERMIPDQPHVGWQTAAKLLVFFSLGALSAVGHHFFYDSLNATTVTTSDDAVSSWKTQGWLMRYGFGLTFIIKTLLVCTVAAAYKQRIWTHFRQTPYTVAGINAISDATTDVLSFASWVFLRRARIAVLLAALTWSIHLSALVTPSSLLLTGASRQAKHRKAVITLDFNRDSYQVFGMAGHVSLVFMRITSTTASNCVIRRMEAVAPNATYSLQFEGPSFKCEEARGSILNFIRTTGKVLKTETITTPDGEVLFFVATATPDYKAGDYYNVQYMGSGDYYGDALANLLGGAIGRQKTNLTETRGPVAQVFAVGTFIIQTALIAAMDIIVNTSGSSKDVNINVQLQPFPGADRMLPRNMSVGQLIE
ncbi:hypothetical protein BKA60DRAFT_538538 [Fusarium oxysporum]|nr:hypothetical protein BKA60DRAFT_538538 [Fusarium oxysporum]